MQPLFLSIFGIMLIAGMILLIIGLTSSETWATDCTGAGAVILVFSFVPIYLAIQTKLAKTRPSEIAPEVRERRDTAPENEARGVFTLRERAEYLERYVEKQVREMGQGGKDRTMSEEQALAYDTSNSNQKHPIRETKEQTRAEQSNRARAVEVMKKKLNKTSKEARSLSSLGKRSSRGVFSIFRSKKRMDYTPSVEELKQASVRLADQEKDVRQTDDALNRQIKALELKAELEGNTGYRGSKYADELNRLHETKKKTIEVAGQIRKAQSVVATTLSKSSTYV